MASFMVSSAAVATINRAAPAQAKTVAPFTVLKSLSTFPGARKANNGITSIATNGGRVRCMQELDEAMTTQPDAHFRIVAFDKDGRKVKSIHSIPHKPPTPS